MDLLSLVRECEYTDNDNIIISAYVLLRSMEKYGPIDLDPLAIQKLERRALSIFPEYMYRSLVLGDESRYNIKKFWPIIQKKPHLLEILERFDRASQDAYFRTLNNTSFKLYFDLDYEGVQYTSLYVQPSDRQGACHIDYLRVGYSVSTRKGIRYNSVQFRINELPNKVRASQIAQKPQVKYIAIEPLLEHLGYELV